MVDAAHMKDTISICSGPNISWLFAVAIRPVFHFELVATTRSKVVRFRATTLMLRITQIAI